MSASGGTLRRGWGGGERSTSRTYWTAAPITYHNEETMRRVIIHRTFGVNRAEIGTEAFFHCWGSESNETAGADTIAILEKDDGTVIEVYPEMIRFLEPHATTAKLAATPANIARACGMENEVERAAEVSATNPPKVWFDHHNEEVIS